MVRTSCKSPYQAWEKQGGSHIECSMVDVPDGQIWVYPQIFTHNHFHYCPRIVCRKIVVDGIVDGNTQISQEPNIKRNLLWVNNLPHLCVSMSSCWVVSPVLAERVFQFRVLENFELSLSWGSPWRRGMSRATMWSWSGERCYGLPHFWLTSLFGHVAAAN